jgi:class 3 adenylate cyclase/tetratricopeptide (TPR) repeat protein
MRCPSCNHDNPDDASFCEECGAKLELICPACKASVSPGARFCKKCGTAIGPTKAAASTTVSSPKSQILVAADGAASEAIDGERKTVTALFADIKGSTELMEELDPEEARAIIDPALKLMIEAVRRYEGYVVQSTGDGIFALFGAPAAYEDHPQRALYAALQMQQQLREHGQHLAAQGGSALEARVGINTGEVVVRTVETGGKVEYTPIGHTANLASRLQTLAPAGAIVVSEHTRKLVEGYFELRALGPMQVRGISEPINVYEVTGLGPLRTHFLLSTRRGLTKFVGRERELAEMRRTLALALAGHGQIVAVVAEAGTGKSRLFHEFKAMLQSDCKVLEAYSVSHGKASAWLPVIELLRSYFAIQNQDEPPARRDKLRARLAALAPALDDTLPYLFGLLGIGEGPDPLAQVDPQVKRQRTLDAIKRLIVRESLAQPMVVIFEDLHWIDSQTQALLNLLADSIASTRALMLVNYRPEYRHEWGNKSYYSQLRLESLAGDNAAAMLKALVGDGAELDPLKRMIIKRTEGNPFFIEEMLLALFDQGALTRNGAVKLARPLAQLRLPPTVQGLLASRIDRQPGEHKQLLQTLAVLGKESPLGLIRQVVSMAEMQLERALAELRTAEFIYEQPTTGGVEYTFKHALTQEVAYNSLLVERRKQLHELTGQALELVYASNLPEHYQNLAYHYAHSDNSSNAVKYLRVAAEQAMSRSAYPEARDQLNSGLELLQTQADSRERARNEIAVRLALHTCLRAIGAAGGVQEVAENLERARERCGRADDDPGRFEVVEALADHYMVLCINEKHRSAAEELLEIALRTRDPEMTGRARFQVGWALFQGGNCPAALRELDEAYSLPASGSTKADSLGWNWRIRLRSCCFPWWVAGFPESALVRSAESLKMARQKTASPLALVMALIWSSYFNLLLRRWKTARSHSDEAMSVMKEHGFTGFLGCMLECEHGCAIAGMGQMEDGLGEMLRWEEIVFQLDVELWSAMFCRSLADTYLVMGRSREGLAVVKRGLDGIRGKDYHEAELRRLRGELLLLDGDAEAAQCFRDAIELARHQGAKSWELRATMSLARLLRDTGRGEEARTMLAEIYNWFTEGFDTADLKDAKALLEQL